jgi:hypothetical protein
MDDWLSYLILSTSDVLTNAFCVDSLYTEPETCKTFN